MSSCQPTTHLVNNEEIVSKIKTSILPKLRIIETESAIKIQDPRKDLNPSERSILSGYIARWAEEDFNPVALNDLSPNPNGHRESLDSARSILIRKGYLIIKAGEGVIPSKDGIKVLFESSTKGSDLSGKSALIQPSADYSKIYVNCRIALLTAIAEAKKYGEVGVELPAKILDWNNNFCAKRIFELIQDSLLSCDRTKSKLIIELTADGYRALPKLNDLLAARLIDPDIRKEYQDQLTADLLALICSNRLLSEGVTENEFKKVLGVTGQDFSPLLSFKRLEEKGLVESVKVKPDKKHPQFRRLPKEATLWKTNKDYKPSRTDYDIKDIVSNLTMFSEDGYIIGAFRGISTKMPESEFLEFASSLDNRVFTITSIERAFKERDWSFTKDALRKFIAILIDSGKILNIPEYRAEHAPKPVPAFRVVELSE